MFRRRRILWLLLIVDDVTIAGAAISGTVMRIMRIACVRLVFAGRDDGILFVIVSCSMRTFRFL